MNANEVELKDLQDLRDLQAAEQIGDRLVADIEKELATLKRQRDLLLKACKVGLARIESDIESDNMKVGEGNILRAAIAEAEKV